MAEMQRIIKDYGFSDLAARLIKLLNLAAFSSEDRVALAAFEAAGVLYDFGSRDRAKCLDAMAAIGKASQPCECTMNGAFCRSIQLWEMMPPNQVC